MSKWLKRIMDSFQNMLPFSVPVDKQLDFLGEMYSSPSGVDDPDGAREVNEAFLDDFRTRVWVSYRRDFPSLTDKSNNEVGITTDAGWGCSIRVTQMLLIQSYIGLLFPRSWRISRAEPKDFAIYKHLLSFIIDSPNAPFSIHQIVKTGHLLFNKRPGDWFGPTTGARAVMHLMNSTSTSTRMGISLISFDSGEIITSEVISAIQSSPNGVILFLTHRLGLDSFNEERYKSTIQRANERRSSLTK